MIRIIARRDGFRRCGIEHSAEPKEYPNDRFTKKQLEQLKKEPMLIVQELPDPEQETSTPAGTGKENGDGKQDGGKSEDKNQKPTGEDDGKK